MVQINGLLTDSQSNGRGPLVTNGLARTVLRGGTAIRSMNNNGVWTTDPRTCNDGSSFIVPLNSQFNESGPHQCLMLYVAEALGPYLQSAGHTQAVIGCAKGGSEIAEWADGSALHTAMVTVANRALQDPLTKRVHYIVFRIGETDSILQATADVFAEKIAERIVSHRARFGSDTIMVIVRLPLNNPSPGTRPFWTTIQAQADLLHDPKAGIFVVQASNTDPGELHENEAQLRVTSQRIALAIAEPLIALTGGRPPFFPTRAGASAATPPAHMRRGR